jgi:hypothetical protein
VPERLETPCRVALSICAWPEPIEEVVRAGVWQWDTREGLGYSLSGKSQRGDPFISSFAYRRTRRRRGVPRHSQASDKGRHNSEKGPGHREG